MKKRIFQTALIVLFLGSNLVVTAQENFIPGTVLMINGEEIEGFIDYRNWDKNPDKIPFKKTENSETVYYLPLQIKNFRVADEIYVSGIVQVEKSPTNKLNHPSNYSVHFNDPNFILEVDTVFLQALFQGEKSLYYLKDQDAKNHFYIFYKESYTLLLYKTYVYTPQRGNDIRQDVLSSAMQTNNKFKGQLTVYLQDCPYIIDEINKLKYDINSISNIFEKYYYSCSSSRLSFMKEEEKTTFEYGPIVGLSVTKIGFTSDSPNALTQQFIYSNFPASVNSTFGFFLNSRFTRNFGKLSFNNELIFTRYSTSVNYLNYTNSEHYSNNTISLGFAHLKLNTMFRYRFELNKATFFVNVGYSAGKEIAYTNQIRKESVFYGYERTEIIEAIPVNDFDQGLLFGIGSQIKKFGFEARFEHSMSGLSGISSLGSSLNRAYFLISYRIKD